MRMAPWRSAVALHPLLAIPASHRQWTRGRTRCVYVPVQQVSILRDSSSLQKTIN